MPFNPGKQYEGAHRSQAVHGESIARFTHRTAVEDRWSSDRRDHCKSSNSAAEQSAP